MERCCILFVKQYFDMRENIIKKRECPCRNLSTPVLRLIFRCLPTSSSYVWKTYQIKVSTHQKLSLLLLL